MSASDTRAVLFDLDDTLVDHSGSSRVALARLHRRVACFGRLEFESFVRLHAGLLDDLHAEVLGETLSVDDARFERFRRLFAAAGEHPPAAEVARVARNYRAAYVKSWKPVPGALELLGSLHGRVRTGVVTNNVVAEQVQKVRRCGLRPHLDALVISAEVGLTKPDPAIFRIALERLDVDATRAVMVGDAWATDVVGAIGAGIRAIWFNRNGSNRPDSRLPVVEIKSLDSACVVIEDVLGLE